MTITLVSTTESAAALNEAAQSGGDELIQAAEHDAKPARDQEGFTTPVNISKNGDVVSTSDSQEDVDAVGRDLAEQRADNREQYLGKTRRKLISQVSRQRDQIDELHRKLAQYEQPENGDEQSSSRARDDEYGDELQSGEQQNAQRQQTQQRQPQPPQNQQQVEEQFRRNFEAAQQRLPQLKQEAEQRIPDLAQALEKLDRENPVSAVAAMHISTLDNPFDVGHYLAQHPGKIARLWALESGGHGDLMLAELNKISAGLQFRDDTRGAQPQRGRQSSAPAPIRPVGATSSSRSTASPGEMNYQDYKAWRDRGGGGGGGR